MTDEKYKYIEDILAENDILLFMKGTPERPFCGFSFYVSQTLQGLDINFQHVNILKNPALREDLKEYNNWPTYPQLFVKGKFIGGHDILKQYAENNTLKATIENALNDQ